MAATAQDLARYQARHWAARPLPEPPRNKRVSASSRIPLDKFGEQLEQWMRDLTLGNTLDGE
jgi:hypothetical protein